MLSIFLKIIQNIANQLKITKRMQIIHCNFVNLNKQFPFRIQMDVFCEWPYIYTALPLCIGTANWGHLEDKMQSDKKNIFFQNFEKVYISQWVKSSFFVSSIFDLKTALGVQDCKSHWSH